jgi:hypothetical protein
MIAAVISYYGTESAVTKNFREKDIYYNSSAVFRERILALVCIHFLCHKCHCLRLLTYMANLAEGIA